MMEISKLFLNIFVICGLILLISCESDTTSPTDTTGYVNVTGGKIWYRDIGNKSAPVLILLHGGPGSPSYYLNPLSPLSNNYRLIFFDQLGCGRSDRITDTTLMTIDNYVEQVQKLVLHLGIKEFYLYGQSWGTILGVEYYSKYPDKVKSLILSSPAIDIERCRYDTDSLVKTLPESTQQIIKETTETGNFESMAYQLAMLEFYQKYVVTKLPWSADMDSMAANTGTSVYLYMWGPSEFTATGTLKTYNGTGKLSKVTVPVQFIVGDHDEISIPTTKYYQSLVPGSKLSITTNAGHLTMQDNASEDIAAIRKFLEDNK